MKAKTYIKRLEALGYRAEEQMPGVLWVEGFGLASSFHLGDPDFSWIDELLDPDAHKERLRQLDETPIETLQRRLAEQQQEEEQQRRKK